MTVAAAGDPILQLCVIDRVKVTTLCELVRPEGGHCRMRASLRGLSGSLRTGLASWAPSLGEAAAGLFRHDCRFMFEN